jgi:hypothetical protein
MVKHSGTRCLAITPLAKGPLWACRDIAKVAKNDHETYIIDCSGHEDLLRFCMGYFCEEELADKKHCLFENVVDMIQKIKDVDFFDCEDPRDFMDMILAIRNYSCITNLLIAFWPERYEELRELHAEPKDC